ncbi:MAG: response regulator transcription factor [Planctomycetes bacterium]|nr:response regulator transcription factor [Planctomycetota bacterium]
MVKILLADDHALLRGMLADRLQRDPQFEVVGAAGTADEAVTLAVKLAPDIIVLDIDMPGLNCFDAARTMISRHPGVKILFLSAHVHDHYIEQALKVGAMGYVTKGSAPEVVVNALHEIAADRAFFSEEIQARIVVDSGGARLAETGKTRISTLTEREMQVLGYIARGLAKKEIAEIMHVSVNTVDKHSAHLMRKLDIHDRVELTRFAIREGLTEP